jgi:hypothetical protein
MSAGMMTVAFSPQLVALIAGSTYPPPDLTVCCSPSPRAIWLLSLLRLGTCPRQLWIVNGHVMVKLLMKPILRCLPKDVEAIVVYGRLLNVTIRQHPRLGHALVGGETL